MADRYYLSMRTGGKVGNIQFTDEDIILLDSHVKSDGENGTWSIFFDGSDVGLSKERINGFYIGDDFMLLPFADKALIDIAGGRVNVKGSDIVKFGWNSLVENSTAGIFELYFDGSDVRLNQNVDALTLDSLGNLLLSTKGNNKLLNAEGKKFVAYKQDLVLKEILAEGSSEQKPVTIHVEQYNPALRLYQRLGFQIVSMNGIYFFMECPSNPESTGPLYPQSLKKETF